MNNAIMLKNKENYNKVLKRGKQKNEENINPY